ncbi:brain-specific angiogenesis inhibitor 1-associated protein 2 isoform X1 [Vidua macroura]|uniref:brain-specific angiogenesis inhibitor 1-associated protein 2 isoform X1 n=1 Tax=Vidua chalybeata TaxID=81927 RepID=UPI0023A86642|nr:brain-specific angiogenesis inhibitor 1-associated protein 2 isoform X1 [Vidua chalybeata]XP_053850541.1 brain-specific angiogenesis inhibitor 1-associated protein 2 isoform X1 [Vidua macroura]
MVLPGPPGMARSEEVHRLTENVYKTIMEQFNPSLRNFISMGKTYEKALASMTYAAKGYFDALVKMGELASESQGSKELGDVLFQMAEVHRQIQNQLEEMLKSFHNELLTQLEQKVELDSRYLSAALKKYQTEQRSKGDSLDKCQAELKKLRKKSQGSKNPQKYSDKELQYIEAISNKQGELENYVSDGYKTALTEERRRFCFLVEKQCAVAKSAITYHAKGKEMLTQKLPLWQQSCSDPNKIPDRAIQLMQQMAASSNGTIMPSPLSTSKSNLIISDPIPGAKPLPVPPELAPFVGRMSAQEAMPVMNGVSGSDSDGYNHWSEMKPAQPKSLSPPQPQKQLSDSYSNTLPVRKNVPPKNSYASAENKTLPRSSSMAAGLERNGRTRVQAIFSHAAGDNSTLLSFKEGDLITLLVPEARDGWHYGESEKTKMRGWFPFSYTRVLDNDGSERVHTSLQQGKSSSTGNLLDKDDISIPPPDYGMASQAFPAQGGNTFKQRPYSVAVPAFSQDYLMPYGCAIKDYSSGLCQAPSAHYKPYARSTAGLDDYGTRSVNRNPFANVQLKPTVTNDRSAPLIS